MRIVRLEVIPVALPFRERYRTASGQLDARSMAVVRLHTDAGADGLGEAVPMSLRGGPALPQVAAELAACNPVLAGTDLAPARERDPAAIRASGSGACSRRCRRERIGAQAICAIDVALHDLAGKAQRPARLAAARRRRESAPIACNATLDAGEPEQIGELGRPAGREGFSTFKVKVGSGDDRARIAAVRAATGDSTHDPDRRQRRLAAAGGRRHPRASSRPTASSSPSSRARSWAASPRCERARRSPIVADESVATPGDAERAIELRACDAATLKLAKVGGPHRGPADRRDASRPILSSALDGPIGIAAAIHTAQALPRGGYASRFAHGLATLGDVRRPPTRPTTASTAPRSCPAALGGPRGGDRRGAAAGAADLMIDDSNRNTALASALVEELARCGVSRRRAHPRARAPARWRWRSIASRRSRSASCSTSAPPGSWRSALHWHRAGPSRSPARAARPPPTCTPRSSRPTQAGVPLLVLTSDRPPELRDIGAGQTIDQIKLYGSAVRWFCEVGTHEADDAGLLHYRSIACRAVAEATRGRGPVHLNLPWRDPLGPEPVPGDVTAADPLALGGPRRRTPADRGPRRAGAWLRG